MKNYPNDLSEIESLVTEVISQSSKNNFEEIHIRGLEEVNELREYHGIRVNLIGVIGRTKTPFSIDFGVGDIIVPSSIERTLPILLPGFQKPKVLTYSLESTVAEKLDAIISLLMEATSWMVKSL